MKERKTPRTPLSYWLRVFDKDSDEALGNLADITSEGLSIVSERVLSKGDTCHLRMRLPAEMHGPDQVDVTAKVRWSRPGAPDGYVHIGFQFVEADTEARKVIRKLIDKFSYQPNLGDESFYPQDIPKSDQ